MRAYFIRRLLLIPPTLLVITFVVFLITRFAPGGPLERAEMEARVGTGGEGRGAARSGRSTQLSQEQLSQLKAYYGFDLPTVPAYLRWLGQVARGDLGKSTRYQEPVSRMILERIPVSATYGLAALVLTYAICIPLGVLKAIRHRTMTDTTTSALIFAGYAVPGYALGALLLVFLAAGLRWFPMSGFTGRDFADLSTWGKLLDLLHHGILPLTCYIVGGFALTTMLVKNNLLDHLASDYIRTSIAKGVNFRGAVFGHALRNSLLPVFATLGQGLTVIVSGSVLVETIFDINGFGLLGYSATLDRDYPVMLGILLVAALLLLLGNILSDALSALLDPRIRFH
jgi:microcin C transport system permease protein